jgi:FMN phosphatase YigB (HAD superfamily)
MSEGAIDTLDAPRGAPDRQRMAAGAARPPGPAVRGIIFDATDIVQDAVSWRRRLARLVHQLGVRASDADFYRRWDRDYLADVQRGRREFGEALESFLLAAGLSWAQIDEVEAASRLGRQSLAPAVRPLASLDKTLAELCSMGVALAAWCDAPRPAAQLVEQLARLALARRFCSVLSSCDVDAVQPAQECYRASLRALGLSVHEVLYVGQNSMHLAGAKAFGLSTVAFNFQPHAEADAFLARFEDLPRYIRGGPAARRDAA